MSRKVYISGTSKGLGKALAENFLEKGDSVIGMSRNRSIENPDYKHIHIDLSSESEVQSFEFDFTNEFNEYILINNAGSLGEIKHIGELSSDEISRTFYLNAIAPMILTNKFVADKSNLNAKKYVLNIGSGASQTAMDGWSLYCSSKASLKMFAEVFAKENNIRSKNVKVVDLAPGIVETEMQKVIRNQSERDFSNVSRFIDYKKNLELKSPEEVAEKIISNFKVIFGRESVVQSIRNY